MDYLEHLRKILAADFDVDPAAVASDALLIEDLDIDSIDVVDLLVRLHEITGKRVSAEAFRDARTVGDVVGVLEGL